MSTLHGKGWLGLMAGFFVAITLRAGEPTLPTTPMSGGAIPVKSTATPARAVPAAGTPSPPPSGTWFIAEYVSVRWEHGVTAFVPGQPVRLIRTNKVTGKSLVSDGRFQVEVAPGQLTRDPAVAAALQQREQEDQRATQAAREADQLAREKARRQYEAAQQRVELNHDIKQARAEARLQPLKRGIGGDPSISDRPYDLKGNPYTHTHKPHGAATRLGFKENPKADDIDAIQRPDGR